jgi:hypothetical protein
LFSGAFDESGRRKEETLGQSLGGRDLIYLDATPPRYWAVDKIVNIAMLDSEYNSHPPGSEYSIWGSTLILSTTKRNGEKKKENKKNHQLNKLNNHLAHQHILAN